MLRKGFDESSHCTSWSSSEPFSSGLSTPMGSELSSTETESEEEDFLAELTRQMANYMLEDDNDDEESRAQNWVSGQPEACGAPAKCCGGYNSTSTYYCDERLMGTTDHTGIYNTQTSAQGHMQAIEVYQLKNQPSLKDDKYLRLGKRADIMSELANNKQPTHQQHLHHHQQHKGQYKNSKKGSRTRAVFFGDSRPRTASGGTGVFLPRVVHNHSQPEERPGCSTVLIPARVLQALESHFNRMDALSQSNGWGGFTNRTPRDRMEEKRESWLETRPATNNQEMQLPEDWTY